MFRVQQLVFQACTGCSSMTTTATEPSTSPPLRPDPAFSPTAPRRLDTNFSVFEKQARVWIELNPAKTRDDRDRHGDSDAQWQQLVGLANVILEEPLASQQDLSNMLDVIDFFEAGRPWVHGTRVTIVRDGSPYATALAMLADLWHNACGMDRWSAQRDNR